MSLNKQNLGKAIAAVGVGLSFSQGEDGNWYEDQSISGIKKVIPYRYNPDTGEYEGDRGGSVGGGSGSGSETAMVMYQDGSILYICKAPVGSTLSSAVWQICKLDTETGIVKTWCDGDTLANNTATDLNTVKNHSYL